MRRVRIAGSGRRGVRPARHRGTLPFPRGSGCRAPRRRRLALDFGIVSRGRHQPAQGNERQLRRRRCQSRLQGDRGGFVPGRPYQPSREGDLHSRGTPSSTSNASSTTSARRMSSGSNAATTRTPSNTSRWKTLEGFDDDRIGFGPGEPRRSPDHSPRGGVQENPLPHERERRRRQAVDAGAGNAYHGILAPLPHGVSRVAPLFNDREARRPARPRQCVAHRRRSHADVRRERTWASRR